MGNYGVPPIMLVNGRGSTVTDSCGREYIDLIAGIAVNALGHGDERMVRAVHEQMASLGHVSNLYATEPGIRLAERLIDLVGDPSARVFFCNSGAEANEAAFKISRLTGRTRVIVAEGSFHGRTMGALGLTAQPGKADPFRPLPGEVAVVPFGDVSALERAMNEDTAALFLEPIQGEAGVVDPPAGYLIAAREITERCGSLLIVDEVQTGIGRTGQWFAYQTSGVQPDVITLAKGLAGGLPMGAVIGVGAAGELFGPGSHGSTFGGNPISAAAALTVLDAIEQDNLLERAVVAGDRLVTGIKEIMGDDATGSRGRGLLRAVALKDESARELEVKLRENGVLVNAVTSSAVRLAPALTISDEEITRALDGWAAAQ